MQIENLYQAYLSSTGVITDTRNITSGNIFFALKGGNFNGNQFAEEAFNKGAGYAVVDEISKPEWKEKFDGKLIVVGNVLQTLQQLAAYHRSKLKCPVLAITGSNGKTTTKELIAVVLSKKYKTYFTHGNLNNHIGIPLTLLSIKTDAEFAVIEMGANHQGEIASYCEYVKPDYGLITNVGLAHTEGFGGFDGVVKGKTELYRHLAQHNRKVFINGHNEILMLTCAVIASKYGHNTKAIIYGNLPNVYCSGKINSSMEFLSIETEGVKIQTNLIGDYNFENVMSAVCVGKYFGVEMNQIKEAIENYFPSNNRSQKITYGSNTIILDAYNANPSSMSEALKNFERADKPNKIVILGEMMELGNSSKAEHEKILSAVSGKDWEAVKKIFVGTGFEFLKGNTAVQWFEKTEEAKKWFQQQHFQNCYILIKGSRKNELEKILAD